VVKVLEGRVRAQMGCPNRQPPGSRPSGCPACAGKVPTATYNFEVYCQETGQEELQGEWADRSRMPEDFTLASIAKVPWCLAKAYNRQYQMLRGETSSNKALVHATALKARHDEGAVVAPPLRHAAGSFTSSTRPRSDDGSP